MTADPSPLYYHASALLTGINVKSDTLIRRLKESIDPETLRLLQAKPASTQPEDYDAVFPRLICWLRGVSERMTLARDRVQERYEEFVDLPRGRRQVVLRNSSSTLLVALARDLMRRSYEERFSDVRQSLRLAEMALEVADRVNSTAHLTSESKADLQAEALGLLGNAKRINSDFVGAEEALQASRALLDRGTGDRGLKADHYSLFASLRSSQGRTEDAVSLVDREIALRHLLGDDERLGTALIDRGLWACWVDGPTSRACWFVRSGVELVTDRRMQLLALLHLAEAFTRAGEGLDAWKLLCTADLVVELVEDSKLHLRHKWTKGNTYRLLKQPLRAERLLRFVRREFLDEGMSFPAALVSVDLLAICVEQSRYREASALAGEAYEVFVEQRLDQPALGTLILLREALSAETATAQMAAAVADFLARYTNNRSLRFEWRSES